jgi:hypothetical protein
MKPSIFRPFNPRGRFAPASLSATLSAASGTSLFPYLPLCLLALLLFGCAAPPLFPDEPESSVLAKRGQPVARYRVGSEQWLEYPSGPFGQQTWFAHIGADGKLKLWEQVLTQQKFASIVPDHASKEDVLHTIGHPAETSYLSLPKLEVWSYRYKENGVWDSMMHVHFDKDGIVRKMQNGPDPRSEREPQAFFGGRSGNIRPW